ncbi:MAG: hypothetical protein H7843_09115 [Nitrospirota bacterium]
MNLEQNILCAVAIAIAFVNAECNKILNALPPGMPDDVVLKLLRTYYADHLSKHPLVKGMKGVIFKGMKDVIFNELERNGVEM